MVTFVQETLVLAKFAHMKNISAVTDPILTKNFGHNFWRSWFILIKIFGPNFVWPNLFWTYKFCEPKILLIHNSLGSKLFWTNIFWDLIFFLTRYQCHMNQGLLKWGGPIAKFSLNFNSNFSWSWLSINLVLVHPPTTHNLASTETKLQLNIR